MIEDIIEELQIQWLQTFNINLYQQNYEVIFQILKEQSVTD